MIKIVVFVDLVIYYYTVLCCLTCAWCYPFGCRLCYRF